MNEHLFQLCDEYIQFVDMYNDSSLDYGELHEVNSQRQVIHDELCDYTGMDRSENMYQYCKNIIHAAIAGGYI